MQLQLAQTLTQNQYVKYLVENSLKFCNDPQQVYNSWTRKQKILFLCSSSLLSLYILYKIKSTHTEYKLRLQGYRLLDLTSQGWEICGVLGAPPSVCAFEIADDKFTLNDLKILIKTMMKSFINFRSQIYKINSRYYYKEEFDPDTIDFNEYVTNIQMKCDDVDADNDTNNEIEEKILQEAVKYLNKQKAFNVQWNTYKRAHIDGFYFHFEEIKKCVIFIRFNHSYGDGILLSTAAALIQTQLGDSRFINKNIDYTNPNTDDTLALINSVLGSKVPNYSIWNQVYHYYMDIPIAWIKTVWYLMTRTNDRKCVFRGEFQNENAIAICKPISVDLYKKIAKNNNGTVNDLFQAMAFGALNRYALKHKCKIFNDKSFNGKYTSMGIVNRRPLSLNKFVKSLQIYSKYGTNANQVEFTPFKINLKKPTIKNAQKSFSKIKYGYTPKVFRFIIDFVMNIPGGIQYVFHDPSKLATVVTSNLKGPSSLIPYPITKNNNNNDNDNNKYIQWIFGMAVPSLLPISFTLITYNEHIRVGVLADKGSIQNPEILMECFMDEWNQYNIASTVL